MLNNFYEGLDLSYPQIAVLAETCSKFSPGTRSFYIPSLMAYKDQSLANDNPVPLNKNNLLNDDKNIGLDKYILGSTIRLFIPQHISMFAPSDNNCMMQPGLEFLVVFAGGDITRPVIIGGAWK